MWGPANGENTRRVVGFIAATCALFVLVAMASNTESIELGSGSPTENRSATSTGRGATGDDLAVIDDDEPEVRIRRADFPEWLLWTVGAIAGAGVLWFLSRQRLRLMIGRRRTGRTEAPSTMTVQQKAEAIADFADELIDELELGGEPRLAIQRAYAAVETGFGLRELKRKPAETPLKYLDRIFGRRAEAAPALGRLTELFQLARFSTEPIDDSMRIEAIDALRTIRDEYRAVGRAKVFGR